MMQRPSDEMLVAFMDGEVDEAQFAEIAAWLDRDTSLRARLNSLSETTALVREAFEPVLREPVPERLFAATHAKPETNVLEFQPKASGRLMGNTKRWWLGTAAAASFACFMFGASISYIATDGGGQTKAAGPNLDNFPAYHNLLINSANADIPKLDFTSETESKLPSDVILPDLKPWGLVFVGGRRIAAEGKPAFQFTYTTDNKDLGPVTLFVTSSAEPDVEPTFDKRENVNLLYWRHRGHGYYIVGGANKGWMWSLKNDIAYQLKAL
jgi:anti-sigma factor RsiW